jgi:hypothetical protein
MLLSMPERVIRRGQLMLGAESDGFFLSKAKRSSPV